MNESWMIHTQNDPLGTTQEFFKKLWTHAGLDAVVVAPRDGKFVLETPDELGEFNPFNPLMELNTARLVVDTLKKQSHLRLGALLRPCELRALNQLATRGVIERQQVFVISVDCLGTFPADEVEWRGERSPKGLTEEALQFAPQGGIAAYRYRPACQMCIEPGATEGDVNIGVFALPVKQTLLVDSSLAGINLKKIADVPANEDLISKREGMLATIHERHDRTHERVLRDMDEHLPANLEALLDQFKDCEDCQTCFNVCPICTVEKPRVEADGRLVREDAIDWLLACAGCGMCEGSCSQHQPLSAIFRHVRDQIEVKLAQ